MRLAPLDLMLVSLLAAASPAAAQASARDAALEKHWPGARASVERRLAENPQELPRLRPPLESALDDAAAFAEDGDAGNAVAAEAATRDFRAALETLGSSRAGFLADSSGLGEIARSILGDAELQARLSADVGSEPRTAGADLAGARALNEFYRGRFEDDRTAPDAGDADSNVGGHRRIRMSEPPRRPGRDQDGAAAALPPAAAALEWSAFILQLREAALAALQAAARAVVLPASALASAVDRWLAPVQRDVKLIAASRAAVEWLSRSGDPSSPALLRAFLLAADASGEARRASLWSALERTMVSAKSSGAEAGGARAALAAAELDYLSFVRGELGDFPVGTRFAGSELGLTPPAGSGVAAVEYEISADGRLAAWRVVSVDGSSRERGSVAGAWTIFDKTGRTSGWSLDAASYAAVANASERSAAVVAAARWLTGQGFKPGGAEMSGELASLLQDAIAHAGAAPLQIYADRTKELVVLDSPLGQGMRQSVARRVEGKGGSAAELAVFERSVGDPNDASTPWREAAAYRGAGEREWMTDKVVSNASSVRRVLTGVTVESVPVALHYVRGADGRWERDGLSRELDEKKRLLHSSAGLVGGAEQVVSATGRGVTDLAGAVMAASMALDLAPARLVANHGTAAELQADWLARAKANLADDAFLSSAGEYYAPGAYRRLKASLGVDDRKYIQNVRKELTEQGHPLLGAFVGAGVDTANGMFPMAAGLGAINAVSPLGLAGKVAADGVDIFWTGQALWSAGVSVKEYARARRAYDERNPASVASYYNSVEGLTNQAIAAPMLVEGLHESWKSPPWKEWVSAPVAESPSLSVGEIGSKSLASNPGLLSEGPLRELYDYNVARRDAVAALVRRMSEECGFHDPPDVASLIKGQEPSGAAAGAYESFREGVLEKVRRKGYATLNKMTDMARGRVSLRDFDAVERLTLQAARTQSISSISYPKGSPPEFVAELKRLIGPDKVVPHKAANKNNTRVHIDLLDPGTGFVYELQVGTKQYNDLMQDPLVRIPQPLVDVFATIDPHGVEGDLANFHLVQYDGIKVLMEKHPEIADLPEAKDFVERMDAASLEAGGLTANKYNPEEAPVLAQSAQHLLATLYQRDPGIFNDLGHAE
jgi:hypothetical protein